jgi:hypothetical protein
MNIEISKERCLHLATLGEDYDIAAGAAPHVVSPPRLRFTEAESYNAYEQWNASCGPHSIAAACGLTLEEVRKVLLGYRGWMNPTLMGKTLQALERSYRLDKGLKTQDLCDGINRIQWEGKWLNPGVPARFAYFHTHYVAHFGGWVFCTVCGVTAWIPVRLWRRVLLQEPDPSPFHITHHYHLDK